MSFKAAKRSIPRRRRQECMPCWDKQSQQLLGQFQKAPRDIEDQLAKELISPLNKKTTRTMG